jgi:hypothetical protein
MMGNQEEIQIQIKEENKIEERKSNEPPPLPDFSELQIPKN